MEKQFQYIVNLAKQYKVYSENQEILFNSLNELSPEIIEDINEEYGRKAKFRPLTLLRSEIVRKMLNHERVTPEYIEEVKTAICERDLKYFQHLSRQFKKQIEEYQSDKINLFPDASEYWNIFFPFFYRNEVKEKVTQYLFELCRQLIKDLGLVDYRSICVDFGGLHQDSSEHAWISIFPIHRSSFRESYQFFLNLTANPDAGRVAGAEVEDKVEDIHKVITSYGEALIALKELKKDIVERNIRLRNYFKYSPGEKGSRWKLFYEEGIAALPYADLQLGDLAQYDRLEDIVKAGSHSKRNIQNQAKALWLFKTANVGDVIFASRGLNACQGIGIFTGEYYYDPTNKSFPYQRKVNWITDYVYEYKANSLRGVVSLFRSNAFITTRVWQFLLNEYAKLYPELAAVFDANKLRYARLTPNKSLPLDYLEIGSEIVMNVAEERTEYITPYVQGTPESPNFWWMNANPGIWSINSLKEGETQTYTTYNEKGNKRRIYKYFQSVKPGDLVIGYESTPSKQIKAIFEITRGVHSTDEGEVIEFQIAEKLEYPVNWNELKDIDALQDCEVFVNNQGSLFSLTADQFDVIREVIDEKNILAEKLVSEKQYDEYDFATDPDRPFMSPESFYQILSLLKKKKNIILQGSPGVGKTFIARKVAYEMMKEINDHSIEMVQFHQSYSYEDFIQGIRPGSKGGFELKEGIFYSFCQRALAHPDKSYFFIIDEINRGNLSKIFGELMMLIEPDKRGMKLKLTYSEREEERFSVPPNLYIIGTMNTADRSLAIVDYALRRRFGFVTLEPDYNDRFKEFLKDKGVSEQLVEHICKQITKVNEKIKEDIDLGAGFQIGHSYFCSYEKEEDEKQWWKEIVLFELKPLLEEIWFDDLDKVEKILEKLAF